MSRDAFGPNLRRVRVQRGIQLDRVAKLLRIAPELLEGLERNDFTGWPTGIFARAYVRQYAHAIGVDPDSTVDEFCRWFPEGDRRAERIVREHALIVGHELDWQDQLPPELGQLDRRTPAGGERPVPPPPHTSSPLTGLFMRLRRAFGKA